MTRGGGCVIYQVPLLRCVFRDRVTKPLPVAEALRRSADIVGLEFEVPTMLPAVLRRLLLPIVLDALGSPPTPKRWVRRFRQGRFSDGEMAALEDYLDRWRERFDVCDPVRPFDQVANLRASSGESRSAALLVATEPTGNNVPLFGSRTEADPLNLTVAEATRWMFNTQCWDTAAMKTGAAGDPKVKNGKTSGNPTGPLGGMGVLIPLGTTLYETLLLNTPIGAQDRLGTPQWRREPDDPRWAGRPQWSSDYIPDGLLDLWTLQSRRIRLFPTTTHSGEVVVNRVLVTAGDRLHGGVPDWEVHTAWRLENPNQASHTCLARPLRHVPGRRMWQGMRALLALEATSEQVRTSELLDQISGLKRDGLIDDRYPLRVAAVGIVYGTKSAAIEDLIHDVIPLPVAALRGSGEAYDLVVEATSQAEELGSAINQLSADLRRALGADPVPWNVGQRPSEQLLDALDPLVRRLLAGVSADADDPAKLEAGQLAWELLAERAVRRCAAPLFDVPPSAFLGREISSGNKTVSYKLGTAANRFDAQIREILPRAHHFRTSREKTG
ncbi:type I-E CRISPR-associated protein Cse1/CasA [Nocardia farcinica]|uniref:type I-E CRISPR-associated protein Cse1/CasA n=1 Tax=Nocardia farcinica TaxID=37329 RepID=UPI000C0162A7|nr:type I-E CRISPR-associated protein Cse1/CasA [Nocardia farcinica]PFX01254.1 CRISPR-associated protein CasA/Cse1 [Nocardia farcinica]